MRFHLRAITPEGRIESLDTQALDEQAARQQAESRGYTVLEVKSRRGVPLIGQARFPVQLFSQELLVLLDAGLPLVEAIDTLAQKERKAEFRTLLGRIAAVLREGQPFSAALEQQPVVFSPLYVATVRAAEKTSDLAPALSRYVAYQAQLDAIRKRAVNAAIYPMILIAAGALVSLFLLLYVVPRFGKIYEDRVADLPFFSQLLIGWGQLVEGHALLVGGVLLALPVLVVFFLKQTNIRAKVGDALWRVPAIGERLKVYQLARLYRTTGMLLRGGMPLVSALGMSAELLHPVVELGRRHRSVSPITASSEPTIAIRSATSPSCIQVAVASSAANDGARNLTRHGRGPPSETT